MEFMNNCCNSCGHDPCSCGGCGPAKYKCDFDIQANPYDPSIWNVTICGAMTKVKIPKMNETDTKLSTNYSDRTLTYNAEKHIDVIGGEQLGGIIKVEDLRDTDTKNANSCDLFVYNPYCSECGDGCKPKDARWVNYHIPDAGDCVVEEEDGYYKVLVKNDCGCIQECRIPVVPENLTSIYYLRDSIPDDPDYPWYYGCYNENQINLFLQANVPQWFGKYDLEVTVNYGIQVEHSTASPNTNFRSLVVPYVQGTTPDASVRACVLQDQSTVAKTGSCIVPWGTVGLRGSVSIIVPKGKEAYLRHEFRLRVLAPNSNYATNPLDGKRVPDAEASVVDGMLYTASRLNSLQVIVRPTRGTENTNPTKDTPRDQLDSGTANDDIYPNPVG